MGRVGTSFGRFRRKLGGSAPVSVRLSASFGGSSGEACPCRYVFRPLSAEAPGKRARVGTSFGRFRRKLRGSAPVSVRLSAAFGGSSGEARPCRYVFRPLSAEAPGKRARVGTSFG